MRRSLFLATVCCLLFVPVIFATSVIQERADRFLALANAGYQALFRSTARPSGSRLTDVTPEHDAAIRSRGQGVRRVQWESCADQGSARTADSSEGTKRDHGAPVETAALERSGRADDESRSWWRNASRPKRNRRRLLNGFEFKLNGQKITANQIDDKLEKSTDLGERKAVWEASKEIGPALKPNLVTLRDLRNGVAKEMQYPDYFSLEVAAYGMTTDEMLKMLDDWMATLRPLYLQLHTWAKYKLAEKYHQPVPKKIPAHWINNRWAQEWPGLVDAANIDKYFEGRKPEWIIKTAEQFYTGLGFSPLPQSFWEKSDLYPVPPAIQSGRKTRTPLAGTSISRTTFVRLQSIEPNSRWFFTAHHELGHGYYFKAYSRPEVPYLLRLGAAPGFHEGVGELISLASSQVPYLQSRGILPHDFKADKTAFLLDDALARSVPFIYFLLRHHAALGSGHLRAQSCRQTNGTRAGGNMSAISRGSSRPRPRSEEWCDAATKTHINDNPAYYYNYAFATVFKFQLHDYIARKILHQPPQSCNYADNKEVGDLAEQHLEEGWNGGLAQSVEGSDRRRHFHSRDGRLLQAAA